MAEWNPNQILGGAWDSRRDKFRFLPSASDGDPSCGESGPGSPVEPPERPGIYPCPCCGYRTFPDPVPEALGFICPVCFWENDLFDVGEDTPSDENHGLSLRQGRENFRRYGAVLPRLAQYVRAPRPEELP